MSHSAKTMCRISMIISKFKKGSSIEELSPKVLHYGDRARVHIMLRKPIPFEPDMGIDQLVITCRAFSNL